MLSSRRSRLAVARLHVIVDVRPGDDPEPFVAEVLQAGAPLLQVRVKQCVDRTTHDLVTRIAARCHAHGSMCVVNDRADIAVAADADGVHLGAEDLPVHAGRCVLAGDGQPRLLGATARDHVTARAHVTAGADYLGVGPCYETTSKTGLPPPGGAERIRAVAAAVDVPVIAVGGITADRVPELLAAGAHGVAVIGAVAGAVDPGAAVVELLDALERS